MNQKEMRRHIYDALSLELSSSNFDLRKSEEGFIRKLNDGKQCFGVGLFSYAPIFEFIPVMSIRYDAVETMCNPFLCVPREMQSLTYSTITSIKYFKTASPIRLTTGDSVAIAVRNLRGTIRDAILPFFDRFEDVREMDNALHSGDPDPYLDITILPSRAFTRLTIAAVAGNPSLETLIISYRQELGLKADEDHSFNKLAVYLRQSVGQ